MKKLRLTWFAQDLKPREQPGRNTKPLYSYNQNHAELMAEGGYTWKNRSPFFPLFCFYEPSRGKDSTMRGERPLLSILPFILDLCTGTNDVLGTDLGLKTSQQSKAKLILLSWSNYSIDFWVFYLWMVKFKYRRRLYQKHTMLVNILPLTWNTWCNQIRKNKDLFWQLELTFGWPRHLLGLWWGSISW